jgi:hypothetical protein
MVSHTSSWKQKEILDRRWGRLTATMLVSAAVTGLIVVTRRLRRRVSGRNGSSGDLASGDFGASVHGLFDGHGHSAESGGDAGDAGGGGDDGGDGGAGGD